MCLISLLSSSIQVDRLSLDNHIAIYDFICPLLPLISSYGSKGVNRDDPVKSLKQGTIHDNKFVCIIFLKIY